MNLFDMSAFLLSMELSCKACCVSGVFIIPLDEPVASIT